MPIDSGPVFSYLLIDLVSASVDAGREAPGPTMPGDRTLPQRTAIRVDGSTYHNMLLQDSSGDPSVPHLARLHPVHDIDLI